MKKTLLTALVIAASVCTALAQDKAQAGPSSDEVAAKEADQKAMMAKRTQEWQTMLVTQLKLTDEQQQKIADMDKAFSERRVAIENNATLTADEKKERQISLRKARASQFSQLLTAEQQAKYKEIIEESKKG